MPEYTVTCTVNGRRIFGATNLHADSPRAAIDKLRNIARAHWGASDDVWSDRAWSATPTDRKDA